MRARSGYIRNILSQRLQKSLNTWSYGIQTLWCKLVFDLEAHSPFSILELQLFFKQNNHLNLLWWMWNEQWKLKHKRSNSSFLINKPFITNDLVNHQSTLSIMFHCPKRGSTLASRPVSWYLSCKITGKSDINAVNNQFIGYTMNPKQNEWLPWEGVILEHQPMWVLLSLEFQIHPSQAHSYCNHFALPSTWKVWRVWLLIKPKMRKKKTCIKHKNQDSQWWK